MSWIAGVDGCRGGWAVVLRELHSGRVELRVAGRLDDVLRCPEQPGVVCVDIPIGLLDAAQPSGRVCDKQARAFLGEPRGRSVFSAPVRTVLDATSYEDAVQRSRASSPHALGLSRQCWGIVPKIAEVDRLLNPGMQDRVVEVHPEVSFCAMNNDRPLIARKKDRRGVEERRDLLETAWGADMHRVLAAPRDSVVAVDDLLDAMAACWTAQRILTGAAATFPDEVARDSRGLRMEIRR